MKRTRRIEVIRYTRRVTLSSEQNVPDCGANPAIDILLEALGDNTPVTKESGYELDEGSQDNLLVAETSAHGNSSEQE
ncbi:MAG: hypothetical protein ACR2LM_16640 [Pyrinomonadaceae bacterium]